MVDKLYVFIGFRWYKDKEPILFCERSEWARARRNTNHAAVCGRRWVDNILTSCDEYESMTTLTTDLSTEYVSCVEVCYNEIAMERANGQELDGLRVRMKGDSPTSKNSQSTTLDFTFLGLCPNKESVWAGVCVSVLRRVRGLRGDGHLWWRLWRLLWIRGKRVRT